MASTSSSQSSALSRATEHSLGYYSSSSGPSSLIEDFPDVDVEDSFVRQKQRAGGPYLCALPAFKAPLPKTQDLPYRDQLMSEGWKLTEKVKKTLNEEGIDYEYVTVTGRQSKVDPELQPVPTVWIIAKRHDELQDWCRVSRKILRLSPSLFLAFQLRFLTKSSINFQDVRLYFRQIAYSANGLR